MVWSMEAVENIVLMLVLGLAQKIRTRTLTSLSEISEKRRSSFPHLRRLGEDLLQFLSQEKQRNNKS